MQVSILRLGLILWTAASGVAPATAQRDFSFAAGTDSSGWAQARSNSEGRVMIESPEYPRGLWLHLRDEGRNALAGIQVEYQGRPNSLVALRCVDPAGLQREALLWTRSAGEPIHLTLKPSEASDLPPGLTPIDWNVDPSAESFLKPVAEARLNGWEALAGFLQQQWPDKTGRVAVQLDTGTSLAVELGHPEVIESLVAHLQQVQQSSGARVGENTPFVAQVFGGSFDLRAGVILYTPLFQDAALEAAVWSGSLPLDRQTALELATSLTYLNAMEKEIHSLAGLEHFTALNRLYLGNNQIADITPLASLTNLKELYLGNNQIADITPLASLTILRVLALNSNQIIDVRPLTTLILLESLFLGSNQITDVRPLTALTNLPYLYLDDNQITDVRPLAALTQLKGLYLRGNQIIDAGPMAALIDLHSIDLDENQVVDVSPMAALTNLQWLQLRGNQIVDISPMTTLTNLKDLSLGENQIVDVRPLADLINLQWLELDDNRIFDVSSLVANPGLGEGDWVSLQGNPLIDQALNEQIPALVARGVNVSH